ncbi:MAG: hypothetical protein VKL60_15070 [Sphaerospermopsis sp.]|nr:hypothetical protein [Sphaerospermopsis sp.]
MRVAPGEEVVINIDQMFKEMLLIEQLIEEGKLKVTTITKKWWEFWK